MNSSKAMDDTGTIPELQLGGTGSELVVCPDAFHVAQAAARRFVHAAGSFIASEGSFSVALAGGNTPRGLYRQLASSEFRSQVDWQKIHLFWGDERAVPVDQPDSNFRMAQCELLGHIPIPPVNVHRMEADRPELEAAIQQYERLLQRYLRLDSRGFPRFHFIILGIGRDGHTASLFPESPELHEASRWVTTTVSPVLGNLRMTLTLPLLNAAHQVLFLVTGADKAEVLGAVITNPGDLSLPAGLVTAPDGRRTIIADEEAAVRVAGEGLK